MELKDYSTEALKAELKRRAEERRAQKAEEMKTALRCRNCRFCNEMTAGEYVVGYKCMARTWGKNHTRNYVVNPSKKACELFERFALKVTVSESTVTYA